MWHSSRCQIGGPPSRWVGRRVELRHNVAGAPHAVSSRVARYSFTARLDGSQVFAPQSCPAIERCLLASAWARLASTAKPSLPAAMHASTENIPFTKTLAPDHARTPNDPARSIDLRIFRAPSRFSSASHLECQSMRRSCQKRLRGPRRSLIRITFT